MLNQVQVMGFVTGHQLSGGTPENPDGLWMKIETEYRERVGENNWTDKTTKVTVFVKGRRAKGLLKLDKLLDAKVCVSGGIRGSSDEKSSYVEAVDVELCGRKRTDDSSSSPAPDTADDIPF